MAEIFKFPGGNDPTKLGDQEAKDVINLWGATLMEEIRLSSPGSRTPEQQETDTEWIQNPDNQGTKDRYKDNMNYVATFSGNLKDYVPTKEVIQKQRLGLKDKHISELMDTMNVSANEAEWSGNRSLYHAIRIEINDRMNIAQVNPPSKAD